jgi:hypothetical protein
VTAPKVSLRRGSHTAILPGGLIGLQREHRHQHSSDNWERWHLQRDVIKPTGRDDNVTEVIAAFNKSRVLLYQALTAVAAELELLREKNPNILNLTR